jgi:HEAT repeat protein
VLEGLETIAWDELSHAYGSAGEAPGLLRGIASPDRDAAAAALDELLNRVAHQGTVYPATVAAVPFLLELAVGAPHHRHEITWTVGFLADDRETSTGDVAPVRAAVAAGRETLAALLDDADPQVRRAAAYAAGRARVAAAPLRRRWAVERDPAVRSALALALGEVDPVGAAPVLGEVAAQGDPQVRVAAATALLRAGVDWPTGTVPALVAAMDDDPDVGREWGRDEEWPVEFATLAPPPVAAAFVERMLRSGVARTRRTGLRAAGARCDARRSAPPVLVPLVASLRHDPDPEVRGEALGLLLRAGAAAGQCADAVAEVAARFPAASGGPGTTDEHRAVVALQRLGDPRWVRPVCAAAGGTFAPEAVRFSPAVLAAVRERLVDHPADARVLAWLVAGWGVEATPLVPHLLGALPHAGPQVAAALLALGRDEPAAVPHWRRAAGTGDLPAAMAVWRLTGDTAVVLDALRTALRGTVRVPEPSVSAVGAALAPLLPLAAGHLTGTAAFTFPAMAQQILAARVTAAVAGPADVLATVEAVLVPGGPPARHAADLLADLALTDPAAVAHLEPQLRACLDDRWTRLSAARALSRLGVPTAELAGPLVDGITDYAGRPGPATIEELRAVETLPALRELVGRDERFLYIGTAEDAVWDDELLRERVEETIAHLEGDRASRQRGSTR